ncbi:MAG: energy-coupling factor transporter transmembrane protein EcfT [Candidatus Cloacimonetes bacterium]|nr:energy-coupling factor transporter transmembrane protein EcfT [Candidatus Cloacimonadota bacterium]MCF7867890.1 energy-coupling factor transporter transmembrane protein EcfT [Candidatus Cloacimonadota bacterium]
MMAITSLSVIYNTAEVQAVLIAISLVLLLSINPSRKRFQRIWHRLKLILRLVVTLMVFQVLFRHEGETLWQWQFIQITSGGLAYGAAASLRFMLIIIIAGLLFDIPYYDYLLAFRAWKFPYEISFLVATVIHFIPIFHRQFQRSKEALHLRGIELSRLPLITRSKAFISLIFPVVARAISEVRYRAISLELRAFRLYPTRTYLYQQKLQWWDWYIQVGAVILFLSLLVS